MIRVDLLLMSKILGNVSGYGTHHPLPTGHIRVGTYRKAEPELVRGNGRRGDRVDVAKVSAEQAVGGRDYLGL